MGQDYVDGYGDEAREILKEALSKHFRQMCDCKFDNKEGTVELVCTAGMWIANKIPSKQVVQEYHGELHRRNRKKTK